MGSEMCIRDRIAKTAKIAAVIIMQTVVLLFLLFLPFFLLLPNLIPNLPFTKIKDFC